MKITVHLFYTKYAWEKQGVFNLYGHKIKDDQWTVYLGGRVVDVDVPDIVDFDPVTREIEVLAAQRDEIRTEAERKAAEIEAKISQLQK